MAQVAHTDRPGPAAESRCRGVCSRRDDALPRRDRGGQRGALEASDFYRESHAKVYRAGLGSMRAVSRSTRSRSSTSSSSEVSSRMRAARSGSTSSRLSSRPPRTPRTTPASCGRWRPCADSSAPGTRSPGSAWTAPARRPSSSTGQSRSSSTSRNPCLERLHPHRGAPEGELRTDHAALRGRRRRNRRRIGLPRARPAHVGLPTRQPRHPRRAAEHGEVRDSRSAWRRTSPCVARPRSRCSRSRCRSPRSRSGSCAARRRSSRSASARASSHPTTGRASPRRATGCRRRRSTSTTPAR